MDTSGTPTTYFASLAAFGFTPKVLKPIFNDTLHVGLELHLERDHHNEFDMFAVRVMFQDRPHNPQNIFSVGFLDRATAQAVGQWMDAGWTFRCEVDHIDEKNKHGLKVVPTGKGAAYVEPPRPTQYNGPDEGDIPF
jgi:hypothetical protein